MKSLNRNLEKPIIKNDCSPSIEDLGLLNDQALLEQTKVLVGKERHLLTNILHHLKEVEKRKLFSELGYKSLFEYAVKELKYSEGQAGRRIQAMRLMCELPEIEERIKKGRISLSNISQAQSYFREIKKISSKKCEQIGSKNDSFKQKAINSSCSQMDRFRKLEVLKSLEDKSSRQGEKLLLELLPQRPLPKEKEKIISKEQTEVKFIMSEELKEKLEEVRSLLGLRGMSLTFSEVLRAMADLSIEALKEKRFGKKRVRKALGKRESGNRSEFKGITSAEQKLTPAPESQSNNQRYIPKSIKYKIWQRDKGKCSNCQSKVNLNFDHIKPIAFGGESIEENLRLLCHHCNQRAGIKIFGNGFAET